MIMNGRKGIIIGLANRRSIAFGIAKICQREGAKIAITYVNEERKRKLTSILDEEFNNEVKSYSCNVNNPEDIKKLKNSLKKDMGKIDFILHSVAFSPKEGLNTSLLNISKESFNTTMNISVYSLIEIIKEFKPILSNSASILAITYYGGNKYIFNYNLMGLAKATLEMTIKYLAEELGEYGIRVNALSPGPIKTLASTGINGFSFILKWNKSHSPLKRNINIDEIGNSGMYLLSNLSSGVTGEIHYVDAGYNIMGMPTVTFDSNKNTFIMKEEN